jgi:PAS domain-containing protein
MRVESKAYMNQLPLMVAQVGPNVLIEDINQAMMDRLGYTLDEPKGRSVLDFMTE